MVTIVGLDGATIEAAGALVAGEHAEARRAHPGLPSAFAGAEACSAALQRLLDGGHSGVVASKRGRALAVMTGIARASHGRLPAEGFAVAPDLDDPVGTGREGLEACYRVLAPCVLNLARRIQEGRLP